MTKQLRYMGHIETASELIVSGWAVDSYQGTPVVLDVFISDVFIARITTKLYRPDILKSLGQAYSGFELRLSDTSPLGSAFFHGLPITIRYPDGSIVLPLEKKNGFIGGIDKSDGGNITRLRSLLDDGYLFSVKLGEIIEPFKRNPELTTIRISRFFRLMTELSRHLGDTVFMGYGTLLGAERSNSVIGHDNDFDAFVLCRSRSLREVVLWQTQLVQTLRNCGLDCRLSSTLPSVIIINFEDEKVDLFVAWYRPDGHLSSYHLDLRCEISDLVPFKHICLGQFSLPAPADSSKLLERLYGPDWKVPDIHFSWRPLGQCLEIEAGWRECFSQSVQTLASDLY